MLHTTTSSPTARPVPSAERPLVLVVDPDRSARAVLEVALSRDGFDVWTVESAQQGLGVLGRGRTPDVIVLESDLGGGDGFSFCAELRGNPKTASVPVVLLARPQDQNVGNLADVVGVDEYVQKPAFARDIAALVRFELVRHRSAKATALRFHSRVLPAAHLLRALLTSARSGTLSLADGAASIAFREGLIVKATFGERWGMDAIVRALALTFHEYTVSLAPVSATSPYQCTLQDYVAQALPKLARWSSLVLRSLPLDAVLAVDFPRLARALRQMPDGVNRIVQLFDGRRRVQQVLLDSAFDEVLTLEVATRLYLMGVIGPLPGAEDVELIPRQAPKLFEPKAAEAEELMRQLFEGQAEIRATDVEPAAADADWVVRPSASAELSVDDPAGGWTSTALPDARLLEGLEHDVARKLEAFNVATVVEPKEVPVEQRSVSAFAAATPDDETNTGLEMALYAATDEGPSQTLPLPNPLRSFDDPDPTPPSRRRFSDDDRQPRLVTPVMTPLAAEPPTVTTEPKTATLPVVVVPAPVPLTRAVPQATVLGRISTVRPAADVLEQSFFESGDSQPALDEPLADEETGLEETVSKASGKKRVSGGRIAVMIALAALVLLTAVGVEWLANTLSATELEVAPVEAALTAPVVVAPVVAPVPLEPVEEISEPEPFEIDVSEPLADGLRAYQLGDYRKAIAVLEQVTTDDPKRVQAWLVLGQARYDAGDAKGAKDAATKVLELDPKNAPVHVLFATLAFDANDKPTMRTELERYLELEPAGSHADEARALLKR